MSDAAHDAGTGFLAQNAETLAVQLWIGVMTIAEGRQAVPIRAKSGLIGSPLARRSANELFERSAECGFGFVADFIGDGGNLHAGIGKPLGGNLHAPLGQILNRRTAHDLGETLDQR
jgi:hypothetical protein